MGWVVFFLVLLVAAGFVWWLVSRASHAPARRVQSLRARWIRLSHLPEAQADEALQRAVARLQEQHPGRSLGWYVAKAVADLERARR